MSSSNKNTIMSKAKGQRSKRVAESPRRHDTPVVICPGNPDHEALRSVIREWLVPALVKQFLAEQKSGGTKNTVINQKRTSEFHGERIR